MICTRGVPDDVKLCITPGMVCAGVQPRAVQGGRAHGGAVQA